MAKERLRINVIHPMYWLPRLVTMTVPMQRDVPVQAKMENEKTAMR